MLFSPKFFYIDVYLSLSKSQSYNQIKLTHTKRAATKSRNSSKKQILILPIVQLLSQTNLAGLKLRILTGIALLGVIIQRTQSRTA